MKTNVVTPDVALNSDADARAKFTDCDGIKRRAEPLARWGISFASRGNRPLTAKPRPRGAGEPARRARNQVLGCAVVVSFGSGMGVPPMIGHGQDGRATANDTTTGLCRRLDVSTFVERCHMLRAPAMIRAKTIRSPRSMRDEIKSHRG